MRLTLPQPAVPSRTGHRLLRHLLADPSARLGRPEGQKWNVSVADGVKNLTAAYTPPTAGNYVIIFGYSQGATVASNFKRLHPQVNVQPGDPTTDYFFIGNPQRPSGGFFERLAFLGNVPILDAQFGDPSPTDTCKAANASVRPTLR